MLDIGMREKDPRYARRRCLDKEANRKDVRVDVFAVERKETLGFPNKLAIQIVEEVLPVSAMVSFVW